MLDLIAEYEEALDNLRTCKQQSHSPEERKLLESMVDSLRFALEQMGRYVDEFPTRTSDGEIPVEPHKLEALAQWDPIEVLFQSDVSDESEVCKIDFRLFTNREIEAYTLYTVDGWSYKQIAESFGIHPGTVSRFIQRAREKIRMISEGGLQTTILDGEMQNTDSYLVGAFRPEHKVG